MAETNRKTRTATPFRPPDLSVHREAVWIERTIENFLEELQRRKDAKEDPCELCDGTGRDGDYICSPCLGQGLLMTEEECAEMKQIAGWAPAEMDDDSILDQQYFND